MRLKLVFYFAIALFLVGSIICAVAPNSPILIFGRAIQGCGCAGIMSGVLSIMAFIVSKEKMPIFIAISSSTYAVSGILGPTIGGVLAESRLTWRFCFWVNLRRYNLDLFTVLPSPASLISMSHILLELNL